LGFLAATFNFSGGSQASEFQILIVARKPSGDFLDHNFPVARKFRNSTSAVAERTNMAIGHPAKRATRNWFRFAAISFPGVKTSTAQHN